MNWNILVKWYINLLNVSASMVFLIFPPPADPVEFETISDRRTGKPIASRIVRLPPQQYVQSDVFVPDVIQGLVVSEAKAPNSKGVRVCVCVCVCVCVHYPLPKLLDSCLKTHL